MKSFRPIRFGRTWEGRRSSGGFFRDLGDGCRGMESFHAERVNGSRTHPRLPPCLALAVSLRQVRQREFQFYGRLFSHLLQPLNKVIILLNNLVKVIISWRGECETAVTCCPGGVHGPRPLLLSHTMIALISTLIRS